jgi:vacuolar-type H+-ATPase subunit I/STV1
LSRCFNEGLSKALLARLVGSQDSLATEKSYSLKILPAGVARGLTDAVFRMDIDGAARATAIVMGFFSTVFGYLVGLVKVSQNQAQRHAVIGNIETANEL